MSCHTLFVLGGQIFMKLASVSNRRELAFLLRVPLQTLTDLLYFKSDKEKYYTFSIPKKSGGRRVIVAPNEPLKTIQKNLASILSEDYEEIKSKQKRQLQIAHGFLHQKNILTNADIHRNKRFVLNLDLENFFDSFHFGRVRGYFLKNRYFLLNKDIATLVAQLACYGGKLPQGAPSSPIITNLICSIFDYRIWKIARKYHLDYTRYADDLSFSTNEKRFIEKRKDFLKDVITEIGKSGFALNISKTRFQLKWSRQMVTGIVVNSKLNTPREFYKLTRSMANHLYKTGKFYIDDKEGSLAQLEGRFSFIYQVVSHNREHVKSGSFKNYQLANELSSREKDYCRFLFYKNFLANEKPVILTEGKTDSIYLKAALKALSGDYPKLIHRNENGSFSFDISFLRRRSLFANLLKLPEDGADGMTTFYNEFFIHKKRYSNQALSCYKDLVTLRKKYPSNPVFLLFDHEMKNQKPLRKFLNSLGFKVEGSKLFSKNNMPVDSFNVNDYFWLDGNFYLLTLPRPFGKEKLEEWEIEQLFTDETLNHKIKGRSFRLAHDKNDGPFYDKYSFAKYIVRNYEHIDFSGFMKLFETIELCLADYHKRLKELNDQLLLEIKNRS